MIPGWGGAAPVAERPEPAVLRPRPAHHRRHVWTTADLQWLRANAETTSRLAIMERFDCSPYELNRQLRGLGLGSLVGRAGGGSSRRT